MVLEMLQLDRIYFKIYNYVYHFFAVNSIMPQK